ncbi:thioredoxin family protein [Sorangium sp. So ce260]|uniref:DUF899 domain-containing protein n=1 Tax=Sorangium sp. So ce260 TaxID=3133291 RepID=UPI003F61CE55
MTQHEITHRGAWIEKRKALLDKEKALKRAQDELAAARRALPWVRVEKTYVFDGPNGTESLAELFGPRSQLIVYHFMFAPTWEAGCKSCSFWADNWGAAVQHLEARDVTLLAVSRAPLAKLDAFKRRMGWTFKWVSSGQSDFNYDFQVSSRDDEREAGKAIYNFATLPPGSPPDMPGFSVFYKDADGAVFHTYSTFGRGIEVANTTYQLLDLVPNGRGEAGQRAPASMSWVRYHDEYTKSA